jgi:signal transduction histidine kinase
MKKIISKRRIIFLAIIIVYVLSQILGTYIIKTSFIRYKIEELLPKLVNISNELYYGSSSINKNTDFILKAYDLNGQEISIFIEDTLESYPILEDKLNSKLISYIPNVVSENQISILDKIDGQSAESIIIGVPIMMNQDMKGVVFLLKPASDFKAVLEGFTIIFTVLLFLGTTVIAIFLKLYLDETKQLEQMRKNYVANVSHELKTPISSIIALTETLVDNLISDPNKKLKYYEIILDESRNLQKLITDMLELSKLQSGKLTFSKQKINGKDFIENISEKYVILFDELDIRFKITEKAMNLPDLYTNEDRILQLLNILLDNARKFINKDGIIEIDAEIYKKYIVLSVIDNGIGIDDKSIKHIFERFNKIDNAMNKEGTGLGLSIAKEIVEGLNEIISVSSIKGGNTSFSFTIQRAN